MGRTEAKLRNDIWRQVREVYKASPLSLRELSELTAITKSRLHRILNGTSPLLADDLIILGVALDFDPRDMLTIGARVVIDVEGTNADPATLKTAALMAKLLQRARTSIRVAGQELTLDAMIGWHQETSGRLENADQILPYLGVFSAPAAEGDMLEPLHIGPSHLAYESLQTTDPGLVAQYIDSLEPGTRREVLYSYFSTRIGPAYPVHSRNVTVDHPGAQQAFELVYATLLLPMQGNHGRDVVVNHSSLLSVRFFDRPKEDLLDVSHNGPRAVQTEID